MALCCVSYDRYKACRRHCANLKTLLTEHTEITIKAKEYFERKKEAKGPTFTLWDIKYIGENLPDNLLGCKVCSFIAKSERGLRIHMKRTHKVY